MIRFLSILIAFILSLPMSAQQSSMEEFMYSSGKMHVVIAIVLIILSLLFVYLFRLDKKVKRMEEEK